MHPRQTAAASACRRVEREIVRTWRTLTLPARRAAIRGAGLAICATPIQSLNALRHGGHAGTCANVGLGKVWGSDCEAGIVVWVCLKLSDGRVL